MYASRNIRMCNKDCLCLFVCPTGATNTENGQIDRDKCIDGCRACVDSCPSGAIYLVPREYPAPQEKNSDCLDAVNRVLRSKAEQELMAQGMLNNLENGSSPVLKKLLKALVKSYRIQGEDYAREAGYMTPEAPLVKDLPKS
jgi:ferredoxin